MKKLNNGQYSVSDGNLAEYMKGNGEIQQTHHSNTLKQTFNSSCKHIKLAE